uniref:Gag1-like clamp domain-containing protein n=1 Tax=Attheya septentrionalis TaxID=420275 RepID=A0A7S2XR72_9STRA|mmetsp:Transcript_4304/g.7709  ORF Transcript_4304/g.7709 Transcript_4304/m.7709 type:complete len:127 (+) Transcript_4304:148-528(+)|eukprot:CAMPEP_0198305722 /NCGR_PEP_ID=MMETSP1449-20131203/58052_1 /TAXON_ID=420275 /ORGANISM="Attheya septentrionalis, Strain CCMP2084" /LENGTH=126 /DNA_ID=CAMNT_0044008259 /DNA_START=132 /DNA_END=512 /DNA_ORIENTATION=-
MSSSKTKNHSISGAVTNGENSESETYVNTGLLHWEKGRKHWLRKKAGSVGEEDKKEEEGEERAAINIDVDEIIDIIFSNRWRVTSPSNSLPGKTTETARGTFAHPVPLPQMVDILVDLWEAEGLDM